MASFPMNRVTRTNIYTFIKKSVLVVNSNQRTLEQPHAEETGLRIIEGKIRYQPNLWSYFNSLRYDPDF